MASLPKVIIQRNKIALVDQWSMLVNKKFGLRTLSTKKLSIIESYTTFFNYFLRAKKLKSLTQTFKP